MSESNKNRKTILLGVLLVVVLVGICFVCVGIYAKKEINKPKFNMPEQPEQLSVSDLPTSKAEAFAYISRLYDSAISADNAEGSWYTDVRLDGEWETPFNDSDTSILFYIRDHAIDQIASFYPSVSNVRMTEAQDIPQLGIQMQDILDFSAEQGHMQNNGMILDTDLYYVTFSVDPASVNTAAMTNSETFKSIADELSSAVEISETQINTQNITMHFVIDRITDQLLSAEIQRDFIVNASIVPTKDAEALLVQQESAVLLPYGTTQHIDFTYYGARFLQRAIAVMPGDMKALPADVKVNAEATKADYTLTFTASEPDALSFDEDGVMTVNRASDDPVTVTMTLDYEGHTYSDQLTVYISEWEVATDVGA